MPDLLADLNEEQRRAVQHAGSPLLVVAGPGSGKTRVLTHRVAYLVSAHGMDPQRIVAVTFTNRAAREMRARLDILLGIEPRVRLGTFHSMCHALLRRYGRKDGRRRALRLLAPHESRAALRAAIGDTSRVSVAQAARGIGAVKNGLSVAAAARAHALDARELESLLRMYETHLRRLGAADLDDLQVLACDLLRRDSDLRAQMHRALAHLLVDEYQDTNPVQQELLALLTPPDGPLTVVGDEDQAIYGWRQAGAGGFRHFLKRFPNAEVLTLTQTYRSSKHILRAACELIAHNRDRRAKTLTTVRGAGKRPICYIAADERDESSWIVDEIRRLAGDGVEADDVAVLYRVNSQARALEDAFAQGGMTYRVLAGTRFYARPEIRAVAAYLRLALDATDDEAAAQLMLRIPGLGEKRLAALERLAMERDGSLMALLLDQDAPKGLPAPLVSRLLGLRERVEEVRGLRGGPLRTLVAAAVSAVGEQEAGGDAEAADNLQELRAVLLEAGGGRTTLRDFIDRLSLAEGTEVRRSGVNLLSLHASKGLEFSVVFIVGVEEGLLPHYRSLDTETAVEEERRLCYVGMTRARDLLYLSWAHARFLGGNALVGVPSRFLGEMGAANVATVASATAIAKPRLQRVRMQERVRHLRWGTGRVVAIEGTGRATLVTVAFDTGGQQRLQLCHAPLERLTGDGFGVPAG